MSSAYNKAWVWVLYTLFCCLLPPLLLLIRRFHLLCTIHILVTQNHFNIDSLNKRHCMFTFDAAMRNANITNLTKISYCIPTHLPTQNKVLLLLFANCRKHTWNLYTQQYNNFVALQKSFNLTERCNNRRASYHWFSKVKKNEVHEPFCIVYFIMCTRWMCVSDRQIKKMNICKISLWWWCCFCCTL